MLSVLFSGDSIKYVYLCFVVVVKHQTSLFWCLYCCFMLTRWEDHQAVFSSFFMEAIIFSFFFLNHCRSSDQMVWWHLNYCLLLLCCPSKALVKVLTWNYHTLNYNFLFHHVSSWLGLGKNKIWSKVWNTSWIELKSIHFTMTLSPSWPPFCWLPWSYNLYWQNFVKTSDCGHIWGEDGLTL